MNELTTTPPPENKEPSVIDAFTGAIDRSFETLFPFIFRRWMVFAVVVWLSGLTTFVVNAGGVFGTIGIFSSAIPEVALMITPLEESGVFSPREFLQSDQVTHLFLAGWGGVSIATLLMGLIAFFASARGKMLLLHNVISLDDEIERPWDEFAREANSLFRLYYFTFLVLFLSTASFFAWRWFDFIENIAAEMSVQKVIMDYAWSLTCELLALFPIGLLAICFFAITNDFVLPIMYKHRIGWLRGWGLFLPLLGKWPLVFLFYFGLRIVCTVVIQFFIQSVYGFLSCLLCFPFIPVINRAPFIPLDLFIRCFPLILLGNMDEQYKMLKPIEKGGYAGFLSYTADAQPKPEEA